MFVGTVISVTAKMKAKRQVKKCLSRFLEAVSLHDADTRVCLTACVDSFLDSPSASNFVRLEFLVNKVGLAFTPVRINFMASLSEYQDVYQAFSDNYI